MAAFENFRTSGCQTTYWPFLGNYLHIVTMLESKSILVTGGTGSFGQKFVETILHNFPQVKRVVVYSRDELKQYHMAQKFSTEEYDAIRYFIGDVRDEKRLKRACEGVDTIVHAAALKQVPAIEYNPMEAVKTNILGAENVINAAMDGKVKRVIALSTDKAAAAINLYGATKLCSDKLFIAANNMEGNRNLKFNVVRYGNVMGSRGSVVPFFLKKRKEGIIPITDERMTRFNISLDDAVSMVLHVMEHAWGGELYVPKIPSYRVKDVATAVAPDCEHKIVGVRAGEKIHEEMITASDSHHTVDVGNYYAILQPKPTWDLDAFKKEFNARPVKPGFTYNSAENDRWLTVEEIRQLVREQVDPAFTVNNDQVETKYE